MSYEKTALIVLMAFALPSAVEALGLGEIHLDSALNEPLAAEVDIVGATAEDLAGITASVANGETFLRFGVDRPAFLSSATFRIAMDVKGQPVLAVRSTESFTEPLVNMVVDLRWRSGELLRQYTLLLDPPSYSSDAAVAKAVPTGGAAGGHPAPDAPRLVGEVSPPASQTTPTLVRSPVLGGPVPQIVTVAAGATLRGIASRISVRGDVGLERLMIAIFHANPNAFEGNINRLRRGAELTVPSSAEVSQISATDANQEFRLQMDRWHASAKVGGPARAVVAAQTEPSAAPQESMSKTPDRALDAPGNTVLASEDAELDHRVRVLESGFNELQGALHREQGTLAGLQARVAPTHQAPVVTAAPPAAKSGHAISIAAVLVLAGGALGGLYAWRRRRIINLTLLPAARHVQTPTATARSELPRHAPVEARSPAKDERRESNADASASKRTQLAAASLDGIEVESVTPSRVSAAGGGGFDRSVNLDSTGTVDLSATTIRSRGLDLNAQTTPVEAVRIKDMPEVSIQSGAEADTAKLQYKLLDLDGTVHYVPMLSIPSEKGGFKERRTSLVDVLKVAVKREPNRRELRMKLLETYYAAAATSRQGFLEVAQSLADERQNMADGEWGKIAGMGRQIAADDDLFASGTAGAKDKLATYA